MSNVRINRRMEDRLSKILKSSYYHPKSRLSDDIWLVIKKKEENIKTFKSWGYSSLSFISLVGFVLMIFSIKEHFVSSGFLEYISLIFSGGEIIFSYWKELCLSIIETIPMTEMAISTFLLFITFSSIRKAVNQFKYRGQILTV